MANWDDQFKQLKSQFITRSGTRLSEMSTLIGLLTTEPKSSDVVRQLRQHFHWLSGSGGTYGFDEVTSWGAYGEELCDYLLSVAEPLSPTDLEQLNSAISVLTQLLINNPASAAEASSITPTTISDTQPAEPIAAALPNLSTPFPGLSSAFPDLNNAFPSSSNTPADLNTAEPWPSPAISDSNTATADPIISPPSAGPRSDSNTATADPIISPPSAGPRSDSNTATADPIISPPSTGPSPPFRSSASSNFLESSMAFPPPPGAGEAGMNFPPPEEQRSTPEQAFPPTEPIYSAPPSQSSPPVSSPPQSLAPMSSPPFISQTEPRQTATTPERIQLPAPIQLPNPPKLKQHINHRPSVVIADGNLTNLGILKKELESHDLQVESFSTVSAVQRLFSEQLPEGMIISVPLPDGSGYELIEELRSKPEGHKPVIIVLGQQSGFLDKVQSIRSGADAFFEYPAEPTEVCKKLSYLLGRDKPEQYKILSVEDDPDQAAFIKLTLEAGGYTVKHIGDPKLFEETFLSFEPDLVLLDVMLGEMTGFDLARYVRQHERFAAVPIIFLTTQNKLHMHIRSARAGCDDHLIKPVAPQLLIATIAGRLEKNRAVKQLIDRDGLTRCLVYGSFMEKIQKMVASEGSRSTAALMMMDVDNLKLINDQYGFATGDRILSNISNLMLKGFRNTELIARYGNDQFAVVLEHLTEQQLSTLASQVINTLSGWQHLVQGKIVQVTCSAGTAFFEPGMSLEDWINKAEKALDQAKEQGKNQAVVSPASKPSGSRTH